MYSQQNKSAVSKERTVVEDERAEEQEEPALLIGAAAEETARRPRESVAHAPAIVGKEGDRDDRQRDAEAELKLHVASDASKELSQNV